MPIKPPRLIRSIRTLFLLAMGALILILSLPLLYSGSKLLDTISYQLGSELLMEKLHALVAPVDRRYETLHRVGLEDSQVHLDEIKAKALESFDGYRYMKSGTVFVVQENGTIVLAKDFRGARGHGFQTFFASLRQQATEGIVRYTAGTDRRLAAFLFYPPWRSYVGISVSEEELFAPRDLFLRINLLVLAVVLAIAVFFTLGLRQFLITPLVRLTDYATRISKGDFSATPTGTFVLELALLKDDISAMVASLRRQMEETARQLVVIQQREEELAGAFAALEESRERLAVTLQSIGDGVITTDTDGRVMLLNGVAQKMTGWSQAEAEGQPLAEVFRIVDAHGDACADPVRQVLDASTTIDFGRHTLLVGRNQPERPIADSSAPIRDQSGKIIGVVLVFRDMTEALRSEEERIKIKKLESVGVLAAGIAHDFNNLLAAILGNLDLAHLLVPEEHESAKLLGEAKKAALRAKGLTQQLLTFAKGGAPVRQVAAIGAVIRDSADFVLRGSNVTCNYDIPDDLWLVAIDQGQMSQVIQNIILNARQAMPDGGTIAVTCRNRPAPEANGNRVAIVISDNGPGMPAATLERIFDPYYTTKSEGSGLGLAVCHSIIIKHHGAIEASSQSGKGTTFTILLPASSESTATEAMAAEETSRPPALRLLLMDDEAMVREISRQMLEYLGHTVQTVAEGRGAIAAYKEAMASGKGFDLAIMDLTIPGGMGGKEAVGEIMALDPRARVLVASGYADDPVMADCTTYGFVGCVKKPFLLAELDAAIRQAVTNPALPTA